MNIYDTNDVFTLQFLSPSSIINKNK